MNAKTGTPKDGLLAKRGKVETAQRERLPYEEYELRKEKALARLGLQQAITMTLVRSVYWTWIISLSYFFIAQLLDKAL